ncbi:aspartyl-tRNA(Asn)/glutamyl-tRNA(Gln) amidotransferase subunit A [Candidatus Hakubella thermalkaliphila]|uniref:Glutamyl-tRNA(Gln) amidotransferase subunit A n=3 Tax=Candidatus Hakubella thermalkaliphila TaxID=2754717 RepID=A0A6V8NWG8_9ACTN|nr:aspartyl-tRNA(Asn)/glutamyl-tRNA(Gln) amidotransferase subunit A [Candidatus Hakubella thermalkaliphila]
MELWDMKGHQLAEMIQKKEVSVSEVTRSVLDRIRFLEPLLNCYITVLEEESQTLARQIDKYIAQEGHPAPLTGLPMAVKDLICTKGVRTTCGSRILDNYLPVYDAMVIQKLKDQRYLPVGKANMDEFAMGSSTENSYYGPTRNPWNTETVPGGSSGGSAAAVAAGEAIVALGSDTGGSIRQPASLCGVVGLKPTYGLVSRYGLVAFASSLDQIGPITRDVQDAAMVLNAIAGHDVMDSTSVKREIPDYTKALVDDVRGLKIGVPQELMVEGVEMKVRDSVNQAIELLVSLGAFCEETSLPYLEHSLSAYYIIAPAEASANLARYDGVKYGHRARGSRNIREMYKKTRSEGFGAEVKRRIMLGTYALSAGYYEAYYGQAQKVRTLIVNDFRQAFQKYDVLVSPTSPTVAFKIGEKVDNPLQMYLSDVCTIPVNLAGIPAISVPCGTADGLPIGLQIIGRAFDEETILRVAYTFEQHFGFNQSPPLTNPGVQLSEDQKSQVQMSGEGRRR